MIIGQGRRGDNRLKEEGVMIGQRGGDDSVKKGGSDNKLKEEGVMIGHKRREANDSCKTVQILRVRYFLKHTILAL